MRAVLSGTAMVLLVRARVSALSAPPSGIACGACRQWASAFSTTTKRLQGPQSVDDDNAASPRLSHIDSRSGRASMVDVSQKSITERSATAEGFVRVNAAAYDLIASNVQAAKGDVLSVAQLAGIMGAKRTSELIPLCHGLLLNHVHVQLEPMGRDDRARPGQESGGGRVKVRCTASTCARTGVEMEALTGASVACLTLWDMVKAVSGKDMMIEGLRVVEKTGGKSGDWRRE